MNKNKKMKLLFEEFINQDEYFLITYGESGDEVHMILMSMKDFNRTIQLKNHSSYKLIIL